MDLGNPSVPRDLSQAAWAKAIDLPVSENRSDSTHCLHFCEVLGVDLNREAEEASPTERVSRGTPEPEGVCFCFQKQNSGLIQFFLFFIFFLNWKTKMQFFFLKLLTVVKKSLKIFLKCPLNYSARGLL